MRKCVVQIHGAADGTTTPHDGRYLVAWNPHTKFGTLECTSTDRLWEATQFDGALDVLNERGVVSSVEPVRPDGKANKPLAALTITIIPI